MSVPCFNLLSDCAGIVLAGGASRRMGIDKATAQLAGMSLVERVVRTIQSVVPRVVIVASRDQVFPCFNKDDSVEIVRDSHPESGPLAGLIDGMRQLAKGPQRTRVAFVSSCDTPFLVPNVVRFLIEVVLTQARDTEKTKPPALWAVPQIDGELQVLGAAYSLALLPILVQRFVDGHRDLVGLKNHALPIILTPDDLRQYDPLLESFFDADTPHDLARLEQRLLEIQAGIDTEKRLAADREKNRRLKTP